MFKQVGQLVKNDATKCKILRQNALNLISAGAKPQTPLGIEAYKAPPGYNCI